MQARYATPVVGLPAYSASDVVVIPAGKLIRLADRSTGVECGCRPESFCLLNPGAVLGKKYLGAWPLIIWEATTAKRDYYRTNYIDHLNSSIADD